MSDRVGFTVDFSKPVEIELPGGATVEGAIVEVSRIVKAREILATVPDIEPQFLTAAHATRAYRALIDVGKALDPEPPSVR